MDFIATRSKKKRVAQLQLAPMIDIFTLIIVFLLKGAVFSETSITLPADMNPAVSSSVESSEFAPQIFISLDKFQFEMPEEKLDIEKNKFMKNEDYRNQIMSKLKKNYEKIPNQSKLALSNLNVVADAKVTYDFVFEVIKIFREAGYNSMLFVAIGETQK